MIMPEFGSLAGCRVLRGAEVVLRTAKTDSPEKVAQRISAFSRRLSGWGSRVRFIPFELPMDADGIFKQ